MICDLNNIEEIIKNDGLNLIVVSYGGSCSNQLVHTLKINNYYNIETSYSLLIK